MWLLCPQSDLRKHTISHSTSYDHLGLAYLSRSSLISCLEAGAAQAISYTGAAQAISYTGAAQAISYGSYYSLTNSSTLSLLLRKAPSKINRHYSRNLHVVTPYLYDYNSQVA